MARSKLLKFLISLRETNWEDLISHIKSYQTWQNFVSQTWTLRVVIQLRGLSDWCEVILGGIFQNFQACTDQGISSCCTTSGLSIKKKKDLLNPRLHMLSKNQWLCLKIFCLFDDILKKLLSFLDNTAGIVTKRSGFRRRLQEIYFLPVVIEDNGYPPKSSTGTLTIRVCGCESDGSLLTCSAEAIFLPVGLSTGALIAILLCIIILLGEIRILFSNLWKLQTVWNMTIFMAVIVSSHFLCGKYFMGFQEDKS